MGNFEKYEELERLLLSMESDDDINSVKSFIDQNNFFKNKKKSISTLRLIGSIVYTHPKHLNNAVKLLNLVEKIPIDNLGTIQYIEDNEIQKRFIVIVIILSLTKHKIPNDYYDSEILINPINFKRNGSYSWHASYEFINKMSDEKLIEARNSFHSAKPIVQIIIDDKIDMLQGFISKNNFDINQRIDSYDFELHPILFNSTPLEYSAFLGAVNCFKFLLMKTTDINYKRLLEFSIAGGNIDIIHIVENESHDESIKSNINLLYLAILYMNNDLIDYVHNSYKINVDAESYIKCIYASNYSAMLKLKEIDDGKEINSYGVIGSSPIDVAAFEGYVDFLKFITTFKNVDIKKMNSYGKTILHSAARSNRIDVVKYIIKHKLIDPHSLGEYGSTPFEIAENYYNDDVISFLENLVDEDKNNEDKLY